MDKKEVSSRIEVEIEKIISDGICEDHSSMEIANEICSYLTSEGLLDND
jgi:hypothetical protein